MKKFFSILAAMLFAGSMMAGTVTLDASEQTPIAAASTQDGSAIELTIDGITIAYAGSLNAASQYSPADFRVFAGKTLKLSAGSTITKVVIAGKANKDGFTFTTTKGNVTTGSKYDKVTEKAELSDPLIVVESINSKSVTFTCGKQLRAYKIQVTIDGEGGGDDPGDGDGDGDGEGDGDETGDITTCAQAAAAAMTVSANEELYNNGAVYTLRGYVTVIQESYKNGNLSFWMADTKNGGKVLEAFRCIPESADKLPEVGDYVEVTGSLTKYNKIPEFARGCTCKIIEKGEGGSGDGDGDDDEELYYDYEPTDKTSINVTCKGLAYEDYSAEIGSVYVVMTDNEEADTDYAEDWAVLEFLTSTFDEAIGLPAGTYQINDSEQEGTFYTSPGGNDDYDYPSYFGTTRFADEGYFDPYYLVSGTVTVTANSITVNAKSYNGSTINLVYNVPTAVENTTVNTTTAVKSLVNGTIIIEHNGVRYNVIGAMLK